MRPIFDEIFQLSFTAVFSCSLQAVASPRLSNPVFQSLSTKNGLPQDIVNDIVINEDGFVWIATEGGLVRWDGVRTKRIAGPDNSLIDSSIYRLALKVLKRCGLVCTAEGFIISIWPLKMWCN